MLLDCSESPFYHSCRYFVVLGQLDFRRDCAECVESYTKEMPLSGTPMGGEHPLLRSRSRERQAQAPLDLDQVVRNLSVDEAMQQAVAPGPATGPRQRPRLLCPVPSISAARNGTCRGWLNMSGLRSHVDGHLLNLIPGTVPQSWLDDNRSQPCARCGKSVSISAANGMHQRCWSAVVAEREVRTAHASQDHSSVDVGLLDELPSIHEISMKDVATKEYIEPDVLAIAGPEFLRCVANAIHFTDQDAWTHAGTEDDTLWLKRCRVAWTELWMFSKVCLPQLPGGKAKANRNRNVILNRLERWRGGERHSLWNDLPERSKDTLTEKTAAQRRKQRQETCIAYAQQGMPGKAIDRLTSSGLAPDTDDVFQKIESKFVEPPPGQAYSRRPPAPESNVLSEANVSRSVLTFARGLGSGPSGTRPDFIRQIIKEKGEKPGLALLTQLCNVLADGAAPAIHWRCKWFCFEQG